MQIYEDRLRQAAEELFTRAGVSKECAEIVTETLICADQRGIHTHGLGKITDYIDRITAGVLSPNAEPTIQSDSGAVAILDAQNGFGQVAAFRGMNLAMEKAQKYGIGLCLVTRSNHFGIASYYSMMAAKKQMIGVSATNASAGIAPFGAKELLYGTNPISVAVPSFSKFPVVLDMSSSVVARGKIRQALKAGQQIPLGWARDKTGAPTTDPSEALEGSLEPVGGPKGSGIALMIEILCGVLTGNSMPGQVRVIKDLSGPCNTGHMLLAIDPEFLIGRDKFCRDMDDVIDLVKSLAPIKDEVFLPGELEAIKQSDCPENMIEIPDKTVEELAKLLGAEPKCFYAAQ